MRMNVKKLLCRRHFVGGIDERYKDRGNYNAALHAETKGTPPGLGLLVHERCKERVNERS